MLRTTILTEPAGRLTERSVRLSGAGVRRTVHQPDPHYCMIAGNIVAEQPKQWMEVPNAQCQRSGCGFSLRSNTEVVYFPRPDRYNLANMGTCVHISCACFVYHRVVDAAMLLERMITRKYDQFVCERISFVARSEF